MHLDNGLVESNSPALLADTHAALSKLDEVKWNSDPSKHLGINIKSDRKNHIIHISQEAYLQNVLDRFGMEHSNAVSTPLLNATRLVPASNADAPACSEFPYREIVGCLNQADVNTRPDISHAVSQLAHYSFCYGLNHIIAAKHLLQFVKGTLDRGLLF